LSLLLFACRTRPFDTPIDLAAIDLLPDLTPLPDLRPPLDFTVVPCPALSLDGFSSYVMAPALPVAPAGFTVEAWLYLTDLRGGYVAVSTDPKTHIGPFYFFASDTGDLGLGIDGLPLGGTQLGITGVLKTNRWSHVAGVFDPSAKKIALYLDGTDVADGDTQLMQLEPSPQPLFIGMTPSDSNSIEGYLAELRISSTARYSSDFVPARRFASDNATLALYHLDEPDGLIAHDDSGNHEDGMLMQNAVFASPPVCR
jgi:hypothetical protein